MKLFKGILNIPNLLCIYRVLYVPVMILLFYLDHIWRDEGVSWPAWLNVILITLAGLSDFLDGKIARWLKKETLLGKFLDSSTDKMVVGTALMCLVAYQVLECWWVLVAIIIFLREILISGVREFMGLYNVTFKVSWVAKWKLTVQMLFIGFLMAGPYGPDLVPYSMEIGKVGFFFAMVLTVWSGGEYLIAAWKALKQLEAEGKV